MYPQIDATTIAIPIKNIPIKLDDANDIIGIISTGIVDPSQSTQVIVNLFNTIVETLTRLF